MHQSTLRHLLALIGCISVLCGVVGIFLPLLPTTPFLLLASYCFVRSSPKLHRWLLDHKQLGPIIYAFEQGNGIPKRIKVRAISLVWISLIISMIIVARWWSYLMLACIGSGVTIYLLRLPDAEENFAAPKQVTDAAGVEIPD